MNITWLFEDLDRLKEELFRAEDKFEEWKIRCKITSCLILIYFTKVGDIECL